MELHHIKPKGDGGTDSFDNCIPLCFDCHSDMSSYDFKHPKGTKYSEQELKQHRDNWYAKVVHNPTIVPLSEHLKLDRATYDRIRELLPWKKTMHFVRYVNFAGFPFYTKELHDFDTFLAECEDPAFEFIDADLEGGRADLRGAIEAFISLINRETFPTDKSVEMNTVPPEWEIEQPERFKQVVKQLHQRADKICEQYDSLIKLARRKLGVG
jgi:hypothetical protein